MSASAERPSQCPSCRSTRVARIQYGLPHFTPELEEELDSEKVVLGGCVVFGHDPLWQCLACGHRWGDLELDVPE
jgi:rubrerythrin